MKKRINLTIDGRPVSVPEGTNIVDAAKSIGIHIPVFCHHPKLKPVGMCRVCLVDVGRPQIDRATGTAVLNEDGTPKIVFGPKLETACTTPVSEGMVVWGATEKVMSARKEIIEFLLTSHPLDCPVCDKGGECPLQNQTMEFGSADSRFLLEEKKHAKKHYPLGDLIVLDRERCIQCARCVRFEEQIAGDPVIGFYNRGRSLEITTFSEPGFDSIFSGNTTDICPVGALTTTDFRFGARSWELKHKPSICNLCPVGCNITYDVRREARSGGKTVIKRVMPRQNESVNEIWICDKGRFTYSYAESKERLSQPLVRKNGELVPVSWDEAINTAAEKIRAAGRSFFSLVSGRLCNEDLYAVKKLSPKIALYSSMGGGEWASRVGMAPGSDISKLEKGSVILVFGSDLHEEAPLWWLRVKQAAERGVTLVVANARKTRLDKYASHTFTYAYGEEGKAIKELFEGDSEISSSINQAENLVIFYGCDGMGLVQTSAVAGLFAERLVKTNHFGRPNNGLITVWQRANDQGAVELGILPDLNLGQSMSDAMGLYIVGVDPVGKDPTVLEAMQKAGFIIVQDLFLTETAKMADVVFPVQASMEREGSFTSGERRVQKFAAAVPAPKNIWSDSAIASALLQKVNNEDLPISMQELFTLICQNEKAFKDLSWQKLGEVQEQWPIIGRNEVYYGGTGYENNFGLGVTLPLFVGESDMPKIIPLSSAVKVEKDAFLLVPITKLVNPSRMNKKSLLESRASEDVLSMHPTDAESMKVQSGSKLALSLYGQTYHVVIQVNPDQPAGVLLTTRGSDLPVHEPVAMERKMMTIETESTERGTL